MMKRYKPTREFLEFLNLDRSSNGNSRRLKYRLVLAAYLLFEKHDLNHADIDEVFGYSRSRITQLLFNCERIHKYYWKHELTSIPVEYQ